MRTSARLSSSGTRSTSSAVSVYEGQAAATEEQTAVALARLNASFNVGLGFLATLAARVKANGFSAERLRDAVNAAIDTKPYGSGLTVADIVSFDRTVRVYKHSEIVRDYGGDFKAFTKYRRVCGRLTYVSNEEMLAQPMGVRDAVRAVCRRTAEELESERAVAVSDEEEGYVPAQGYESYFEELHGRYGVRVRRTAARR